MRERGWSTEPDELPEARPDLRGAIFIRAHLRGADLRANLRYARFGNADLCDANLRGAGLRSANLGGADLGGADLRFARLDVGTQLYGVHFDSRMLLADVGWGGAPLTRIQWQEVERLGDERLAREPGGQGSKKDKATRLDEYTSAVVAYRQLATVLRSQGGERACRPLRLPRTTFTAQSILVSAQVWSISLLAFP